MDYRKVELDDIYYYNLKLAQEKMSDDDILKNRIDESFDEDLSILNSLKLRTILMALENSYSKVRTTKEIWEDYYITVSNSLYTSEQNDIEKREYNRGCADTIWRMNKDFNLGLDWKSKI